MSEENEPITVDPKRVSAWNRWFQERQQKLKQLKEQDPLFRDNDIVKENKDDYKRPDQVSRSGIETKQKNMNTEITKWKSKCPKNESAIRPLAEALREASLKEKDKQVISYDCYSNQSNAKLIEWLNEFKPTKVRQKNKDVGAIVIYGFDKNEDQLCDYKKKFEMSSSDSLEKHAKLIEEWNDMTERSDVSVNYSTICNLAKKYAVLGGKWMFSVHHHTVNVLWSTICREINKAAAAASRRYKSGSGNNNCSEGIPCIAAKISSGREVKGARKFDGEFMILVYTSNFMEDQMIFDIEKSLRRCGIHSTMTYKPDIFSILGIYRKNKFKLRPTIYQSCWVSTKNNAFDDTANEFENGSSIIESSINEFKVEANVSSDIREKVIQNQNRSTPSFNSENLSTERRGKLGRNIVLEVLKRKEHESKEIKTIDTSIKKNPHKIGSEDGATICVGSVPHDITDDMIKNNFETKYGKVMKVERRSVCYVTFEENKAVKSFADSITESGGRPKVGTDLFEIEDYINKIKLES